MQVPAAWPVRVYSPGLSRAINGALDLCKTRWVAILDADDWWPGGSLQAHLELAHQLPTSEVVQGTVGVYSRQSLTPKPSLTSLSQRWQGSHPQSKLPGCSASNRSRAIPERNLIERFFRKAKEFASFILIFAGMLWA